MATISLGQTLTGDFNSSTPRLNNGTGNYYYEYDLPTSLTSFSQIQVAFNPNGVNTPSGTYIDLINTTTGAILSETYSGGGYTGAPISFVDDTIYSGITYKIRVANASLSGGNFSLSLNDKGQATSLVSRGFAGGNNGSYGYQIGTLNASGVYSPLASATTELSDVALSPSGLLYGITSSESTYLADRLHVIDPSLGVGYANVPASSVSNLKDTAGNPLRQSLKSLAFSSNNQLYAIGTSGAVTSLYQIDIHTSVATALATLPLGFNNSGDLVYDAPNNRFLATSAKTGAFDALWQIPLGNPAGASIVGNIVSSNANYVNVKGLAFENGQLVGYAPAIGVAPTGGSAIGTNKITIDAATGAVTAVQNLPLSTNGDIFGAATIVPLTTPVRNDFNGDGKSDILWRNTNGNVALWQMNGSNLTTGSVFANVPTAWTISNTGDFNGDSKADILWRNADGQVAIWQMNGATPITQTVIGSAPTNWQISGTGDFNGDGKADILWRNTDGSVAIWKMNGNTPTAQTVIGSASTDWKISGTGDFNGDGKSDILWRKANGDVALWQMNGTTPVSQTVFANVSTDWQIAGTGDFNGDGKADILWRNNDGQVAIWAMNGTTALSKDLTNPYPTVDNSWKISGTGDFNGDGKADILWRNNDGSVETWLMNGSTVTAANLVTPNPVVDNSWKIAAPIL